MDQPRFGSVSSPGRREADLGLAGLGVAGLGGLTAGVASRGMRRQAAGYLGARRDLRQARRDGAAANAEYRRLLAEQGRLQERFARGGPAAEMMRVKEEALAVAGRKRLAESRGAALRGDASRAKAEMRGARSGLSRLARGRAGVATAAGLAGVAGGGALAGWGLVGGERRRARAIRDADARRRAGLAAGLAPAVDDRPAVKLVPRGAPEGSRSFREDPSTGRMVRQPSKRQAKFGSWISSGKSGEQWQRDADAQGWLERGLAEPGDGPLTWRQVSR